MRRFTAPSPFRLITGLGLLFTAAVPTAFAQSGSVVSTKSTPATATAPNPKGQPTTASKAPDTLPPRPISTSAPDCRAILETMKADFAREPGRVLLAVEDALTTQETCACSVVRAAVGFVGSDSALIAQIVLTAIRTVPSAAARITECAIAQSPESADAIRGALAKELGESTPSWIAPAGASEKTPEPGGATADDSQVAQSGSLEKNPVPPAGQSTHEPEAGYGFSGEGWPTVNISGIYVLPRAGNGVRISPDFSIRLIEQAFSGKKKTVQRPIFPVTRNIPE